MAALGRAGIPVDPNRIDICFDDVMMVKGGVGCGEEAESRVAEAMEKEEFTIMIDVNAGNRFALLRTCDFSLSYVKINVDYRTRVFTHF